MILKKKDRKDRKWKVKMTQQGGGGLDEKECEEGRKKSKRAWRNVKSGWRRKDQNVREKFTVESDFKIIFYSLY